jgi:hypothetical protein
MSVVSFTDYTPIPRFDDVPWTTVMIEESISEAGPWTLIDTQNLMPIDGDPSDPMPRSFTTDNATADSGLWYRISFGDNLNNVMQMTPTFNGIPIEWTPTIPDVAGVILIRTRDENGVFQNTFTDQTIPTDEQVRQLIDKAVNNVRPLIGTDIPEDLIQEAQDVTAIRAAMYVELTFFGNEVAQNRSVYPHLKELFDEKIAALAAAVVAEEAGESPLDALAGGGGMPEWSYPPDDNMSWRPF